MCKRRTNEFTGNFLMWENGIAVLKSKNKRGIILYDKSVFQGGKFIEVRNEIDNRRFKKNTGRNGRR